MAHEPDTPDVRSLAAIGLISTFATIAISLLVVGLTHSEGIKVQASRETSVAAEQAPAVSEDSKQAVIQKYAK